MGRRSSHRSLPVCLSGCVSNGKETVCETSDWSSESVRPAESLARLCCRVNGSSGCSPPRWCHSALTLPSLCSLTVSISLALPLSRGWTRGLATEVVSLPPRPVPRRLVGVGGGRVDSRAVDCDSSSKAMEAMLCCAYRLTNPPAATAISFLASNYSLS